MVVFYDKTTLEIVYTESNTSTPTLPSGTIEEKRNILNEQNLDFLHIENEMGMEIYKYIVIKKDENVNIRLKIDLI